MEYDDSICCVEAEQNIIWSKEFLYKRNYFPKERTLKDVPDISHMHQSWWMYDDIPF